MGDGLGSVIVLSIPPYQVMYQEFSQSMSDIFVSVGQKVTKGQRIGQLNGGTHLHLGITKKDWRTALASWDIDDGSWLNPIEILRSGGESPQPNMEELKDMLKLFKINTGYKSLQVVNTETLKYFAMNAEESARMRKFLYDKEPLFEPAEFQNVLDIIKHVL